MTILTFYSRDRQNKIEVVAVVDLENRKITGERADMIRRMVLGDSRYQTLEGILGGFYDCTYLFVRIGEPWKPEPLPPRMKRPKTIRPTLHKSKSEISESPEGKLKSLQLHIPFPSEDNHLG